MSSGTSWFRAEERHRDRAGPVGGRACGLLGESTFVSGSQALYLDATVCRGLRPLVVTSSDCEVLCVCPTASGS